MRRRLECTEDLRVHVDGHLALLHQLAVAGLDVLEHPVGEGLAGQRVDEVDHPLPRQLLVLVGLGQEASHFGVLRRLLQELLDAEPLVLGHRQVLHLVAVEELALAVDQRLEEVDGVAVVRRQVGAALDGEEVVPAEKVSEAQGTYTSRLDLYLEANMVAVTCCCYCSANILARWKLCWR